MSFVDLATLTLHRRNEMEERINSFNNKCENAIQDIHKLKSRAQGLVQQLNCEPSQLKERFLSCMKQLDEYIYLVTDFNLAMGKLEESNNTGSGPVHDIARNSPVTLIPTKAYNFVDTLSDSKPSTSVACSNQSQSEKPKSHHRKIPKEDQVLILFSSTSGSMESMPTNNEVVEKIEKEVQCKLAEDVSRISVNDESTSSTVDKVLQRVLPAQTILQVDCVYPATIMANDGLTLWIITDEIDEVTSLMIQMKNYYSEHITKMSQSDITSLTYCAFFDPEDNCFYRGLFIRIIKDNIAEVFVVDTGELKQVPVEGIQPLVDQFCDRAPFARCCHLAGVNMYSGNNKELLAKQEKFIQVYNGMQCEIKVDDNTSETLGVYVILPSKETLNNLIIKHGLAVKVEPEPLGATALPALRLGPPELNDENLDISGPEHEDPLEAVTGYHSRDEAEICKHYKGGVDKTCFKGSRCKKRHVLINPDGWTLDRVPVVTKISGPQLPPSGTWFRMQVTYVCHFDRLYGQIKTEDEKEDVIPSQFGVILPPTTLAGLVRAMNSPGARTAYKPLTMIPAPGEIVAALYPPDDQWYRARVLSVSRSEQSVEVIYIDYGNVVWVKEDAVCVLEPRFVSLPAQGVQCVLAGVDARTSDCKQWVAAKDALAALTLDRTLAAHVIGREYEELTVELYDECGYNVAERLAADDHVMLKQYDILDDTNTAHKLVVP